MSNIFGAFFSQWYQHLNAGKDYLSECGRLHALIQELAAPDKPPGSILELGCGSGMHSLTMAQLGYDVIGVDRSDAMLNQARSIAHAAPGLQDSSGSVSFFQGEIGTIDLNQTFDGVMIIDSVLGYGNENSDVLKTLQNARKHLRPGGILILEPWYGPAVLMQTPSSRERKVDLPEGKTLLQTITPTLDISNNLCRLTYDFIIRENGAEISHDQETHGMRYFFIPEITMFLENTGFRPMKICTVKDLEKKPDHTTWHFCAVAIAQ